MTSFTVGHEASYDKALAEGNAGDGVSPVRKCGPFMREDGQPYHGGIVFETMDEALSYLEQINKRGIWAVYEIAAEWPTDTWDAGLAEGFRRINRDAEILRKVAV